MPRNILTKNVKKGPAIDSVLFSKPTVNAIGDPWRQLGNITARRQHNDLIEAAGHERVFRPAKTFREDGYKLPYAHMSDRVAFTKNFKDEEGAIMVAPRNVQTNPMKRGRVGKGTNFSPATPHMPDDFDRPRALALEASAYHRSKLQEKPFSQRAKSLRFGLFNAQEDVYALREDIKARPPLERVLDRVEQDRPFRPSHPPRKGKENSTLAKFPAYIEDPPVEKTRVKPDPDAEEKPRFKTTTHSWSRPTPSIAMNRKNLKTTFPSVFARRGSN